MTKSVTRAIGITTSRYSYIFGGVSTETDQGNTNDGLVAEFKSAGQLGDWVKTDPFPTTISCSATITINKRVYVLGGWAGGCLNTDAVYYSEIQDNGKLGKWILDKPLPASVSDHSVVLINDTLILLGGVIQVENMDVYSESVYYCKVDEDGQLGDWVKAEINLPEALTNMVVIPTSTRLYIVGGGDDSRISDNIYYATIKTNNELSAFTKDATYPEPIELANVVVTNNMVAVWGGMGTDDPLKTSRWAYINAEGVLGDWTSNDNLDFECYGGVIMVDNTTVYVVGCGDDRLDMVTAPFDGWV